MERMNVIILGSGRIGSAMARDLAADAQGRVTVVDHDSGALELVGARANVATIEADLSHPPSVTDLVADHDLVINAMPGFLGFQTLEAVLHTGRKVVDIAFFPEDPFDLDELAKRHGAVAVVDMGVSPGMSGVLVGHAAGKLDTVEDVAVYVGGLPVEREQPWEYKAVFSPIDVIEEYVRPARMISAGQLIERPALSEVQSMDFPGVGTLEAFNTDGLRTLLNTIPARNMVEKTLRYPGHADKMRVLRDGGFFAKEPLGIEGSDLRAIDFTARLLFPKWQLGDREADLTVMRIEVAGQKDGERARFTYELSDRYDPESDVTSMARTTGYAATMVARLVHQGGYDRPGISPPEYLGAEPSCVEYLLEGLASRGVIFRGVQRHGDP